MAKEREHEKGKHGAGKVGQGMPEERRQGQQQQERGPERQQSGGSEQHRGSQQHQREGGAGSKQR